MSRSWSVITFAIFLMIIAGCSGGGSGSPLLPPNPGDGLNLTEPVSVQRGATGHVLWGLWQGVVDIEAGTFELVPLRGAVFHVNMARLLGDIPGALSAHVNSIDVPARLLDVDVTITHPVPDSNLRGFDVRGILMGQGELMVAESDPSLTFNSPAGTRVLNADGYTRWWNATEFTSTGFFGYDNTNVVPGYLVPETTLNPYKYFADPLGPDDPVVPGVNDTNRGTFSTDGNPPSLTRNYLVRFPIIGGKPKLGFHYAIDASFAPPTGGSSTPKPVEDYPPEANCPEAFHIEVNTEDSWAYYESEQVYGGDLVLEIEVFDWGAADNPDGILSEIGSIMIESPTLFDGLVLVDSGPMPGFMGTSAAFNVTVEDVHPTDIYNQEVLVTVRSREPNTYAAPIPGADYPEQAALAAYALVDIPIYVFKPEGFDSFVSLENPNGGEYWLEGNVYEIEWSASEDIENVRILFSSDSGESFLDPITMSTPNDGSYTWYVDPEEITEGNHSRIRIVDVMPTMLADESDADFTIFPESLAPIHVTSPNGGEIWKAETTEEIAWDADPGITYVRIELSQDGGATFPHLVTEPVPNNGAFMWDPIPSEAVGESIRIKVSDAADPSSCDVSNAIFSIKPMGDRYIDFETPIAGDTWRIGRDETADWVWDGIIPEVHFQLYLDGMGHFCTLVANLPNSGSEVIDFNPPGIDDLALWTATELTGQIRIEDSADPAVFDEVNIVIPINLGILYDMVQASSAGDADDDNIPDDVEIFIGTDPNSKDSDIPDPDAFFDNFEIFGQGYYDPLDLIPDQDQDGVIAPLDTDDNGDGMNDGETADSDFDGIPNYLEYYGYTYEWMSGTYSLWDGSSIDEPYFKTDPLQPSTDQDPYPDGMEVSGILMDVSVEEPGDYPMVPAYPNIVVRLEGYEVTVDEQITVEEGESIEQGTQWGAQTERTHGYEREDAWEIGTDVEAGYDQGPKCTVTVHSQFGQTFHHSNSTAVTVSEGGSTATESEWSRATCSNPSTAARIKLFLKVYNRGTSCASNVTPTLTLRVGNMHVTTFEPSTIINLLEPGGVYPAEPNTYWVVDYIDTGRTQPLYVTLNELRAIECGAPVSLVMTQMTAQVMLMNESGQWQSAGDWGEYMARCEAACAQMYLEIGGGNFLHYQVYADDSPSAPTVRFGDALVWAAGAATDPTDLWITYLDQNHQEQTASLADWDFTFDSQTLEANGFIGSPLAPPEPEYNILDVVLGPESQIVGKIPRNEAIGAEGPDIVYAYLDEQLDEVNALAVDYNGIEELLFIDKNGTEYPMDEVIAGSGFYTFGLYGGYVSHQTDGNGMQEKIRAQSLDPTVAPVEKAVQTVVYPAGEYHAPPVFDYVFCDPAIENHLTVEVTCDEQYPLDYVRAYHPELDYGGEKMIPDEKWWLFPNRYHLDLPVTVTPHNATDMTIVAVDIGGEYSVHDISANDLRQDYGGSLTMDAWYNGWPCALGFGSQYVWVTSRLDIDVNDAQQVQLYRNSGCYIASWGWQDTDWDGYHWGSDFWIRYYEDRSDTAPYGSNYTWLIMFNYNWCQYTGPKTFEEITEGDCQSATFNTVPAIPIPHNSIGHFGIYTDGSPPRHSGGDSSPITYPAIFIMRTSAGNYAKIQLSNPTSVQGTTPLTEHVSYCFKIDVQYETFNPNDDLSFFNSGSDSYHAEYGSDPGNEEFVWSHFDFDSKALVEETSAGTVWDPLWNPVAPVDLWFRYYSGDTDPYNGGSTPGYMFFSNLEFKVINGDIDLNSLTLQNFLAGGFTEKSLFILEEFDSLDDVVTLLLKTDAGRYVGVKFMTGTALGTPPLLEADCAFQYMTFE